MTAPLGWPASVLARRDLWGRAPSAHNTQPWLVREVDGEIEVGWDEARHLRVGDPGRRDLMLSLGTLVESLVITAAEAGHATEVAWKVDVEARTAARVTLVDGRPEQTWTTTELVARRTARSAYAPPHVTPDEVAEIGSLAGARLHVVPQPLVDELLPVADRHTFDGPATAELAQWLRLRRRDPRYREDGLTDQAMGLSRPEALGLAIALRPPVLAVLRATRATRLLAASSTARPTGTVVTLVGPADATLEHLGELGQTLLRSWLAAARLGLSCHPLSQLIDCPQTAARLPAGAGEQVVAVFRVGRPSEPPPRSARLGEPAPG